MPVLSEDARVLFVMLFFAVRVGGCSLSRHWRVNRHRQNRYSLFVFQFSNQVNELLRATDSKRGNEHGSAALRRVVDDARKRHFRIFRIVQAIAVSRFHEQVVTCRRPRGIANDWLIVVAQVAGKQDATSLAFSSGMVHFQQNETRSENVSRDSKARMNSRRNLDCLAGVSYRIK